MPVSQGSELGYAARSGARGTAKCKYENSGSTTYMGKQDGAKSSMMIGKRNVGRDYPPLIIGELSANHNGSLDTAIEIIDAIAEAGADAVKLQTYTADTITLDSEREEFQITEGQWAGQSLYELYQWAHTPWEWHEKLFNRARDQGLLVFSSPFDHSAVDFLEQFDPPAYKIASFELVDLPLIEYVASKGRPMIMSTGMADSTEIMDAVASARRAGCTDLCLLHCTSGYPTPAEDADLRTIPQLAERYDVMPGLSDHTLGTAVSVAAVALGACVIEKHVTMRRSDGGPDAGFSLEPEELKTLVDQTSIAWRSLGQIRQAPKKSEAPQRPMRRSLYISEDIKSGEQLTPDNLRSVRPGHGAPPRDYHAMLYRRVNQDVPKGTPASWAMLE